MKFSIQLFDRVLSIVEDAKPIDLLGAGNRLPYDSVQDAIRRAMDAILREVNALDSSGRPDHSRLPRLVISGDIDLELHGHERETNVAALHLWVAYGVPTRAAPWNHTQDRGAARVAADSSACFYDTYRFEADIAPIEHLAEQAKAWRLIVSNGKPSKSGDEVFQRVREALGYKRAHAATGRPARIRIGVLGATGAGKSSFINALLQRFVTPSAVNVCSSCVIELRAVAPGQKEVFEIEPLPDEARRDILRAAEKQLKAAQRQHTLHGDAESGALVTRLLKRVTELEAAEKTIRRYEGDKQPLTGLARFVTVTPNDLTHEFVARARVHLAHKLLEHAIVVDTPGLRDINEQRRRVAIAELARLDGWLYLSAGDNKFNKSVADDIAEIREQANNTTGAIILTKSDKIGAQDGVLTATIGGILGEFAKPPVQWTGPLLWCSASPLSDALEMKAAGLDESTWPKVVAKLRNHGLGFANRLGDPCTYDDTARHFPSTGLLAVAEHARDDVRTREVLLDYLLDMSGVPTVARGLARVINEQAIRQRLSRGRDLLLADVREWLATTRNKLVLQRTHLANLDSLAHSEAQQEELRRQVIELTLRTAALEKQLSDFKQQAEARLSSIKGEFANHAQALVPPMLADLKQRVTKDASGELRGERHYSMFDMFDAPLARWCSDRIRDLHKELCESCAATVDGLIGAALVDATGSELSNYSLHRKHSDAQRVVDYEKLFEWFDDSTIPRMQKTAVATASVLEAEILTLYAAKFGSLIEKIGEAAGAQLHSHKRQKAELESTLDQLIYDARGLRENIPETRDSIARRVTELEARVSTMEGFERALAAENLDANTHVDRVRV